MILPRGEISNSRTKSRFLTLLLMYIDFVWYKSQLYEYKSHKLSIYEYKSHFGSGFLWYKSHLQYKLTFLRCNDVFKQYKRDVSRYKTAFFVIIAWSASCANFFFLRMREEYNLNDFPRFSFLFFDLTWQKNTGQMHVLKSSLSVCETRCQGEYVKLVAKIIVLSSKTIFYIYFCPQLKSNSPRVWPGGESLA